MLSKDYLYLQQKHLLAIRILNDVNRLVTRVYDGLIRDTLNISILFNLCFHQTKTPMSNKAFAFIVALIVCIPNQLSAQSLPNFLPTSDLEGWWPFNGDTSDYVGTNDIKKHAAVFTVDRYGSNNAALSIPSTYLELPYASYLDKDDFTISLWVNGGSTQGDRCYVKKGIYSNATREDYYLGLNNSSQFHIGFKGNNSCQPGQGWATVTTTSTYNNTSAWTHLVFIHSDDTVKLYRNAQLISKYFLNEPHGFCGNSPLAFGSEWNGSRYLNGTIDDIGFWSRGLTETEITAIYTSTPQSCSLLSSNNEVICKGDSLQLSANVSVTPTNAVDASKFTLLGYFGGKAYYQSNSTATYQQALQEAQSVGAELLKINNAQLNQFIASNITQVIMLGATDSLNEGSFTYPDGSSLTYSNWYSGEPNNQQNMTCPPYTLGEDYIALSPNGKWNDIPNFVCPTLSYQYKFGISIDTSQANSSHSILWSTGDTTSSIQVSPSQTTTYWVTDGNGCYDTIVVQVLDSQISSSASSICTVGDSVLLWNGIPQIASSQNIGSCSPLSGTLANGLIGWYPFCGNADDESTLGNDGSVFGASLSVDRSGVSNQAYEFDITSTGWGSAKDRIETSSTGVSNALSLSNAFTISAWVNLATKPGNFANRPHSILGIWDGTGTPIVRSQITYSGQLSTSFPYNGGSAQSTSTISYGQWHHVVQSFDGDSIYQYIDGIQVNSQAVNFTISSSTATMTVGEIHMANGHWYHFSGSMDELGIWDRALSKHEIQSLANSGISSLTWSTGESGDSIWVKPTATTTYTLTQSLGGTSCTDSITVSVEPVEISATSTALCLGDSVQLSISNPSVVDTSDFSLIGYFGGKAYYESKVPLTYQSALTKTKSIGAEMLKIDNAQLNQFISTNMSQPLMLGATDSLSEGNFIWSDGSSLSFSNWKSGEPNNAGNGSSCRPFGEDYIVIGANGQWNDIPNSYCGSLIYRYYGISIDTSQATNNQSFLWSTGETTSSIQVSPLQTTTYWVTTSSGCSDTVQVSVLNSQINSATNSICNVGDSVLLWSNASQLSLAPSVNTCSPFTGTLTTDLIGWYPYCGNADDLSGGGKNGSVYGASLSQDRFNNPNSAYKYDGVDDYIDYGAFLLNSPSEYTISAWVKFGSFSQSSYIFSQATNGEIQLSTSPSGVFSWNKLTSGGSVSVGTNVPDTTDWHHVVAVFDDNNNTLDFYLDNIKYSTTHNSNLASYNGPALTGRQSNVSANFFKGSIDDLAIWERSLTSSEIQSLSNVGSPTLTWSTGETGDSIWVKPTATTTFTLTQSLGGTSCTDSITISVEPVKISATSTALCLGDSTTLSVGGNFGGSQSLYSEDFEGTIGPEWSSSTSMSYNGSMVLGNFDNTTVSLSLGNLPTDTISISFDLWLHDTWDGNQSGNGPDFWSFKFNQSTLLNTTFNNHNGGTQSYPDNHPSSYPSLTGNVERITTDLCSGGQGNTRYRLEFKVYNNQSTGLFSFIGNASQSLCDESWSIDNVVVSQKGGASMGGYIWSTGDTTASITVAPTSTTSYWVTNTTGCSDTLVVEVIDIDIIGDTVYCVGDEVVLTTNYRHTDSLNCDTSYFHGYDANYNPGQAISGYAYKGLHNGHHYYLANNPTKWTRAAQNAKDAGGHLVCINDAAEQAFIQNLSTSNLWIGLYRNSLGDFDWVNCDTLGYTNWRSNEPGNNEPYVHILTDNCFGPNQWNDLGDSSTNGTCYSNCYGVLEIDPNSSYSTSGNSVSWNSQSYQDTLRFSFSKDTTIIVSVTVGGHTCYDTISLFLRGDSARIPLANEYLCQDDTLTYTLPGSYDQNIQWFDLDTSRTRSFSSSGMYFVQGLDSSGCYIEDTLKVTVNKVELLSSKTNLCPNEEVTLWLDSSNVISNLLWNTGSSNDSITIIPDSSSVYWVNQAIGSSTCYDSVNLNVSELSYSIDSVYSYNGFGVRCFGASDGGIVLDALSSYLPLQILWSDSTSMDSIYGVEAGDYWFRITDSLGCSASDTVSITEPTQLQSTSIIASNYNGFNISCNGLSDGKAYIQYQGGVPGYSVYVNGSLSQLNTDTLYGFNDGLHIISVVDSNGCSTQDTLNFIEPSFLNTLLTSNASYNGFDVSCNGFNDGTITPTTTGGVIPYTYTTQSGTALTNIIAGDYNVQTQDANGCIRFDSITLTQPDSLVDQSSIVSSYSGFSVSCFGSSDGKLELDFYGGVGPYQYQVNGNSVQSVIVGGLSGGSVSYQVTDNNSCVLSGSLILSEPSAVNVSASSSKNYNGYDISCYGFSDGQAIASATGGTGQFSFLWNTLPPSSTALIDSLNAGLYVISVTDSNGCMATDTVLLSEPQPLLANAQQLLDYSGYGVSCYGASDGGIYAAVTGGVPSYNYIWNSGQYNQDSVSGLAQGTYNLLVEDVNGCKANSSITLTNPQIFTTSVTSLTDYNGYDIKCNGGNSGIILAASQGGVGPYSFNWSHSSNPSPLLSNLLAGQYDVVSVDANGCVDSSSITLFEPQALSMSYVYTEPICYLDSNGTADLNVQGGVGPYTISWSNGIFGSYSDELWASTYYLTITDTNDCVFSDSVTITDTDPLGILVDTIPPTCDISNDGYINVMPYGGFTPYVITMNGSTIPNIVDGIGDIPLYITVSDQKGCDTSLTIDFSAKFESCLEIPNLFSPNGDNYNDVWNIGRFTEFDLVLKIYNPLGQLVYESNSSNYIPWDGLINGKNAPNGDYYYYLESRDLNRVYKGYVTVIR